MISGTSLFCCQLGGLVLSKMDFRHQRRAPNVDLTLPGWHNFHGCWSSPLTARWADDSYEEGKVLGRGMHAVSLNPRDFRSSVALSESDACLRLGKQVI